MLIAGTRQTPEQTWEVRSPFTDEVVDLMPVASSDQTAAAVGAAVEGARTMRSMPAHERAEHLERFSRVVAEHAEELALTVTREEGKPLRESRIEAARVATVLRLSAHEATRLTGEVLALDAAPNGVGRFGFTLREPCGVVAAITPFNYPASLVALKLGPALAAGNAVVVKPPADTPLAALLLARYAEEAGLPPLGVPGGVRSRQQGRAGALRRPSGPDGLVHRQQRGCRADHPSRRGQAVVARARLQRRPRRPLGRRRRCGGPRQCAGRVRQRRAGLHLRAASDRRPLRPGGVPRCAAVRSGRSAPRGPHPGRDDPRTGDQPEGRRADRRLGGRSAGGRRQRAARR